MLLILSIIDNEDDKRKLGKIYKEYAGFMIKRANRILDNLDDAEDAVQNAFIKIANHLDRLEKPISDDTKWYVVTAAENAAIDIIRKKTALTDMPYEDFFPSEAYYKGKNRVTALILSLSPKDRDMLLLRHLYGYNYSEMGEVLKMSEEAVRKAVKRAELKLETSCREEGLL